ncbi:hypothetical protein [Clostridium sp. ATCC 25772]|uniref:hypothetical protein n=1 Tax=Clostridium sp. ATCC 25772 TaxID=1676991 RepID=UPI000785E884|nr:hypothetical protein [Clostridium sp. ATCC 25772]
MKLDFLNQHHIRMKKIGAYSLLFRNSISKRTWDKYGFIESYEQDNLIFSVLLFIMEQSLKEELCTIDDIGGFIDEINSIYYKKSITYEDCKELGEFIVNVILCDEGKAMYFKALDYRKAEYCDININFIKNRMEYIEEVRRVSYSLTEEGYELILSTLEVEESLKLTIQEIIFKLHLDKASYDKALDDMKNIFNNMRRRVQKMEDDIRRIKESPLTYSVDEYKTMMEGNIEILNKNRKKFLAHKESIEEKILEFEEKDIHIKDLNEEETENLMNLRIINEYLGRTIDEEQRILKSHFDLKSVYGNELENISKMALIERFDIRNEVFNKVLENPNKLENIHMLFSSLFTKSPNKNYNINKAFQFQQPVRAKDNEEDEEILSFSEEGATEMENKRKLERIEKCNKIIELILEFALKDGKVTLSKINNMIKKSEVLIDSIMPTVEIFREVIIEMLKARAININELKEERKTAIESGEIEFQLNKSILDIIEGNNLLSKILVIRINKVEDGDDVKLEHIKDENGDLKNFICSDIIFEVFTGRNLI